MAIGIIAGILIVILVFAPLKRTRKIHCLPFFIPLHQTAVGLQCAHLPLAAAHHAYFPFACLIALIPPLNLPCYH